MARKVMLPGSLCSKRWRERDRQTHTDREEKIASRSLERNQPMLNEARHQSFADRALIPRLRPYRIRTTWDP